MNRALFSTFTLLLLAAPALAGVEPPYPVTELFPVEPGINNERGFAVAVDGDWLAMGAPRDDGAGKNAGAVYLFHWSGTTWDPAAKLFADPPRPNAQLGLALAMRGGVLAAGAPGEGAVYLFAQGDGVWVQKKRLTATGHGAGTFGCSLALDGNRLAVGALEVHGTEAGAVYLYSGEDWSFEQKVRPQPRQEGERFGSAVSLAGNILAVGAPGHGAGAIYVFRRGPGRWNQKAKLLPPDESLQAGAQLGFAVATDGDRIFAGAPTADLESAFNAGAVFWFEENGGVWSSRGRLEAGELHAGDQLGTSLALSGNLLAVSAPAPPSAQPPVTGSGQVHLFRGPDSWEEEVLRVPDNAELRDLAGFAVAADGERIVVGGVLGDQGGASAGAVWSFRCPAVLACDEEVEAVARDPQSDVFGISVALTQDFLAVGAQGGGEAVTGRVYLSRRAGNGWRQSTRLSSPFPNDGFGTSVSLEDDLLAVGAPGARFSPVSPPVDFPDGSVDLFVRQGSSWVFEATLAPPEEPIISATVVGTPAFGTSVAIENGVVAVGAPSRGAVYLFRKGDLGWSQINALISSAEGFGSAISLHGGVLTIGAPGADGGRGTVYVSVPGAPGVPGGAELIPLDRTFFSGVPELAATGTSVAVGDGILAVGAPGFTLDEETGKGAVFLFEGSGTSWRFTGRILSPARRRFGSSVALLGNRLVVGGPGENGTGPDDLDRAAVFERQGNTWVPVADLDALQPPHGDKFGSAVALSEDFFVVTSPGSARRDRVTVFDLRPPEGENP